MCWAYLGWVLYLLSIHIPWEGAGDNITLGTLSIYYNSNNSIVKLRQTVHYAVFFPLTTREGKKTARFPHQHSPCWWVNPSWSTLVFCQWGAFPTDRIQWSLLEAIAAGSDRAKKNTIGWLYWSQSIVTIRMPIDG